MVCIEIVTLVRRSLEERTMCHCTMPKTRRVIRNARKSLPKRLIRNLVYSLVGPSMDYCEIVTHGWHTWNRWSRTCIVGAFIIDHHIAERASMYCNWNWSQPAAGVHIWCVFISMHGTWIWGMQLDRWERIRDFHRIGTTVSMYLLGHANSVRNNEIKKIRIIRFHLLLFHFKCIFFY